MQEDVPREDQPDSAPLQPPPAGSSIAPDAVSDTPPAPPVVPTGTVVSNHGGGRGKTKFIIMIILVLAVAAALAGYLAHSSKHKTVATKKDIPYLTYGFEDTSDITPTYPVDTPNSNNNFLVDSQLFEGLVRYQDQIKIAPALATSWFNPNDTTWVFNLRHNVRFHSGRIMTASDVKASLDYAVANQSEDNNATFLTVASNIDQVSVVNPYQVKITTKGPDAVLLNQLVSLFIEDSKAKLGDPNAGTGPYTVKPGTVKPKATTLDLVASNNYWDGHVYTRAIHFQEDPTFEQLAADTSAGKFDMAGDFPNQQLATIKTKVTYYQPITIPDLGISYLELNLEKAGSPLQSLAARQAERFALNPPAIIKAGSLNGTPVNQVIPQTLPGYDPSIKATPYNPTKAKQLLATVPNASAPLTLFYPTGDEGQVGEIAKELNAVGFNVKTAAVSDFDAFINQLTSGQGDMFYLSDTTATLDGLDIINNTVAGTPNYTSPELTRLINQAGATIDPTTRIVALQKIEQLVAKDIPTIALYTQIRTYVLTKPYVVHANIPGAGAGIYFYQVYQR